MQTSSTTPQSGGVGLSALFSKGGSPFGDVPEGEIDAFWLRLEAQLQALTQSDAAFLQGQGGVVDLPLEGQLLPEGSLDVQAFSPDALLELAQWVLAMRDGLDQSSPLTAEYQALFAQAQALFQHLEQWLAEQPSAASPLEVSTLTGQEGGVTAEAMEQWLADLSAVPALAEGASGALAAFVTQASQLAAALQQMQQQQPNPQLAQWLHSFQTRFAALVSASDQASGTASLPPVSMALQMANLRFDAAMASWNAALTATIVHPDGQSQANAAGLLRLSDPLATSVSSQTSVVAGTNAGSFLSSESALAAVSTQSTGQTTTSQTGLPRWFALDVPMQQPGWDRALGSRVQWMANQNVQLAEIRLNPPHLGPLEVRLQVEGERTNVQFIAPQAATREAVESALPRLREMFQESGMQLGDVTVTQQDSRQGRPGADQESADGRDGQNGRSASGDAESEPETLDTPLPYRLGMLDLYA